MLHQSEFTPTQLRALNALMEGNARYVARISQHPHQSQAYRESLETAQHPFAAILGCADSRVPPELIFDQGLGDLFVIRVAGNLVDELTMASVEYAVCGLGVQLVMVLSHSHCGAVTAAVEQKQLDGCMPSFTRAIEPAVIEARRRPGDLLENAIRVNAQRARKELLYGSSIVRNATSRQELALVVGHYDLHTGAVELLD